MTKLHYSLFAILAVSLLLAGCEVSTDTITDAVSSAGDAVGDAYDSTTDAVSQVIDTVTPVVTSAPQTFSVSGLSVIQTIPVSDAFTKASLTLKEGLPENAVVNKDISLCIQSQKIVLNHTAIPSGVYNGKFYSGGIETSCVLSNDTVSINRVLGNGFSGGGAMESNCGSPVLMKDGDLQTASVVSNGLWCDFNSTSMFASNALYESKVTLAK